MNSFKIVFFLLLFTCCTEEKNPCNVEAALFAYPTEPKSTIYEIEDIWVRSDSIANVLCKGNLSSQFLKIDSFYFRFTQWDLMPECSPWDCVMRLRKRERIQVIVNSENTILFEGKATNIEKLDSLVMVYYLNEGKEDDRPTKFSYAEITVDWDKRASQDLVKNVIREMSFGYSNALQSLYSKENSICDSISQNDRKLLRDFPYYLGIRFGKELRLNGRLPIPEPPPQL